MADLNGVDPILAGAVNALIAMSHGQIWINSGFRSHDQQAKLWAQNPNPNLVAPPGHSNHEKGLAVDLGGNLALAHQLAARLGLSFPMSWEPWHVELPSTRDGSDPQAYTHSPFGDPNPTADAAISQHPDHVLATGVEAMRNMMKGPELPHGENVGFGTEQPQVVNGNGSAPAAGGGGGGGQQFQGGGASPSGWDKSQWAKDFLSKGGFPTTDANIRAVQAWAQAEGGFNNNNPLNTTGGYGFSSHNINSVGVKYFDNYGDSIAANLNALFENHPGYDRIRSALMAGNDPHAVANAVGSSPWGTSGQLMNKILAG